MSIEVEQFESWIGSEVQSDRGDKLGRIEEVYFAGADPIAIGLRSGLAGRKHHAATLRDASVSRDGVRLAIGEHDLVSTDGGPLTDAQVRELASHDDRLSGLDAERIEGWQQREERREQAEAARAEADELEEQARRRAAEEQEATAAAGDAESTADDARREREDADARAHEARVAAERADAPDLG